MTPKFMAYTATAAFDASQSSSTFTKFDISQSFFVTPAAIAGVIFRVYKLYHYPKTAHSRLRWGPNHYDCAAALPAGVIESQPLVCPNWATPSHPCALAYLIAVRISFSLNPKSAAT